MTYLHDLQMTEEKPSAVRSPILPDAERLRILYEWNDTTVKYPRWACVHEMFEDHARRTPNAVAVEVEDEKVSYGELNRQANRLAHYLQDCGVKPDVRVALCLERSVEMVVAMLAVSKAGGHMCRWIQRGRWRGCGTCCTTTVQWLY